jgi:drug/metabolite transporter (DMT)-like permease
MKLKTIIGISLIVIGVFMMVYTGFKYVTTDKVVDLGSVKIEKEKNHFVQWSPFVGIALVIGGVIIIIRDKKIGI